jgi:transcription termination/antitermination protein NusG
MAFQWYVVQVLSGQEKKIKKWLDENKAEYGVVKDIEEVLVPSEKVSEVKKGEQKIVEKRIWPGYLLIKMDLNDEAWAYVINANGVIDFLGGDKPSPLSDKEVTEIMSELEEKKKGVVQKHKFDVGDNVKITEGVFVNFVGVVTEVFHDKGRLSVLVSIFGRETRVDDLEFWQVEHATKDKE